MHRVMLDLETLGVDNDSAIISIGAVAFDPFRYNGEHLSDMGPEFYTVVNQDLQVSKWDRKIDPRTLKWWSEQSPEAKEVLYQSSPQAFSPKLDVALHAFGEWLRGLSSPALSDSARPGDHAVSQVELWGNGSDFDNVILADAYHAVGMYVPWSFSNNRCFRTLKNLGIKLGPGEGARREDIGVHHHALHDAKYQAIYASAYLRRLAKGQGVLKSLEASSA